MTPVIYRTADQPRVADIVTAACKLTALSRDEIMGRSRQMHICRVRNAVCYVARSYGHGYSAIGRALDKDHKSIMHACNVAGEVMAAQPIYRQVVSDIKVAAGRIHAGHRMAVTDPAPDATPISA